MSRLTWPFELGPNQSGGSLVKLDTCWICNALWKEFGCMPLVYFLMILALPHQDSCSSGPVLVFSGDAHSQIILYWYQPVWFSLILWGTFWFLCSLIIPRNSILFERIITSFIIPVDADLEKLQKSNSKFCQYLCKILGVYFSYHREAYSIKGT